MTSPGTVTLNGDIDLNASTLYLRGCGAGAINGAIREGGDDAIRKMDTGTWTLSGANTFTGLVTIAGGTLKVGASGAVASATPVAVAGGAVYLDSDDPGTEWAVQTMRMEAGNYRLWVNEKGYGPDTGTATFTPFTRLGDGGLSADFAEVLVYTNLLSDTERVNTIRYLRRKWLGEGEASAADGSLSPQVAATVRRGTVLNLGGGAQAFAALTGGGTVTGGTVTVTGTLAAGDAASAAGELTVGGDLALAAGMTNAVDCVAGASDVVQVSGTLSVAGSATVALSLNGRLPPAQITLFTFGSIDGEGNLASWSVVGPGLEPFQKRVKAVGNAVVLSVFRGGAMVLLR